jgi:hypothetical protein
MNLGVTTTHCCEEAPLSWASAIDVGKGTTLANMRVKIAAALDVGFVLASPKDSRDADCVESFPHSGKGDYSGTRSAARCRSSS